jgi:hypothetical protein
MAEKRTFCSTALNDRKGCFKLLAACNIFPGAFGRIPGGGNGSISGGGFEQNTQAGENGARAASNYPDFGQATVLHGIDPSPAGCNGVERRVDLVDRALPALAVALAGYKERKHEYCL